MAETRRARAALAEIASRAGLTNERVRDVAVAGSEAVANAIEHSAVKGEVVVRASVYADRLEVEVESPGAFRAPVGGEPGTRGMGLRLMAGLADDVALRAGPAGGTLVTLTFWLPATRASNPPMLDDRQGGDDDRR